MLLLVSVGGLAAAPPAAASDWLVKCWTMDDGLPSTLVSVIAQGDDGYLWLGTGSGLVRFDGVRFVSSDLQFPAAVPLYNYHARQLWIRNTNGDLLVCAGNRFQKLPHPPGATGGPYVMKTDSDGITWVHFGDDICRWSGGRWLAADEERTVPDYAGRCREGLPGEWWCILDGQPGRWSRGRFLPARTPDGSAGFRGARVIPGLDGGGWLLTGGGQGDPAFVLRAISPEMIVSQPVPVPWNGAVLLADFFADRTGNVWLSSGTHGVLRRGPSGDWEAFNSHNGLSTDSANVMLEDAEGNIWIATDGGGLYRLSRRRFRTYGAADGLTTDNVYAVAASRDGGIWAGAHGNRGEGLFRLRDGAATPVLKMGSYAWSVLEDSGGDVWAGNFEDGLFRMQGGEPARVPGSPGSIFALCEDSEGSVWYGGNGLGRVEAGQARAVAGIPAKVTISSLSRETGGTLWIGSPNDGLYSLLNGKVSHFTAADGLLNNEVLCVYVDSGNSLWVGTTRGINRRMNGRFAALTQENGLSPRVVSGLAEDGRGNVWIHSNNGIYRIARRELDSFFSGKAGKVLTIGYGREDGLATGTSTTGSQPRICRDRDGRMWFATLKGAAVADPATMPVNTNPPPVVIEEILIDGKMHSRPMASPGASTRPGIREQFPPGGGLFEIHYTANSFCAPEKVQFRYRLEGISPAWVEAGERRSVVFNNLPHGDYRFEVTACNNDGVWNQRPASFAFTVLPFFWQTLWFKLPVILAAGAGLAYGVRWFSLRGMRRQLALAAQAAAVERERTRISRDMHDDLGARLTKISILSELAGRGLAQSDEAQGHFQSLSKMARATAASLSDLVWIVKPTNDTVRNLANHLCQCADEFLRETPIRCRFDIPDQLPDLPASAEVRQEVSLAVKEALNNAVKHSGATEVHLAFQITAPGFVVILSDNGRGLDPRSSPGPSGGNGLPNMRRRMERIGGTCDIGEPAGGGVVVTLTVPNRTV